MRLNKFKRKSLSINITSLIDVMFILLLFFVVTSTFKEKNASALDLELPKSDQAKETETKEEVTLFLDKENHVLLNDKRFPLDSLKAVFPRLLKNIKGKPIVIKGDQEVTYQSFIKVFDVLKEHDIPNLILAAEQE